MAPVLEARGLSINFGAVIAADNVHLSVEEREVVGIIGANGAGKTTFVNMVTGHLSPAGGEIRYLGRDVTGLSSRAITRLGIRRSFQIPQLFGELTVLDNVLIALGLASRQPRALWQPLEQPTAVAAAHETLSRFDLSDYAAQKAGLLPQGVRKLLDIAMATVGEPRLLLLDEPTSGISVDEKFPVMDKLMAALAAQGVCVMFVEHDMEIVERYARRIAAFYDGRVIAEGPPAAVLADPDVRRYVVGAEIHRKQAVG